MLKIMQWYRAAHWCHRHSVPLLPQALAGMIRLTFGAWLPPGVELGRNVKLGYGGLGVVIHARARVGDNVVISQHVTIGGKNDGVPVIENNVYIGAGAVILGGIRVGSGSIVGANAVVVKDVPPRSMVGGVPARVIRRDIDIGDYERI